MHSVAPHREGAHPASRPRRSARFHSRILALAAAAMVAFGAPEAAAFQPYVIRNASALPNNPPAILVNNVYVPGATELVIAEGGQKAGLGSSAVDGTVLGKLTSVSIARLDDETRFAAGSGPRVAPYLNFWITDGNGNFAVVANEPSDPAFQPLYADGYNLTWADLANKVAKVYENSNLSWLPTSGSSGLPAQAGRQNPLSANLYTFANLAGYIIQAPTVAQLTAGWPGLGTGAPRELGTNLAWGVNWVFGDTLSNYVSGAEGYVVASPAVSAPAAASTALVIKPTDPVFGVGGNNVVGEDGDSAPGFTTGNFKSNGVAKTDIYFSPQMLFGRAILLGEVKSMSYWTKKGTAHAVSPGDWYLTLYTEPFPGDVSTPTWYGARLGSEPYFSENLLAPASTWNVWKTDSGANWLRFFESTAGAPGANFGAYNDLHWSSFLNGNSLGTTVPRRNQAVHLFSIQTATGWAPGFTGKLDGLTVKLANGSVATVNFETDDDPPVALDATVNPGTIDVDSQATPIQVTGIIDDSLTDGSDIVSAEFSVDGGAWTAMAAADAAFDSPTENVAGTFTLAGVGITSPGVYSVCIRGTDAAGLVSNEDCTLIAVYDPDAGFVSGGGWINSPAGAYAPDATCTGKANFGFISKYKKGANVPDGSTEFVFNAGGLNFHSSAYEWLVVNQGGTNAQFKGSGTVNGGGNYGFMIWATDNGNGGATDTLRIHIWDKDNADATLYDNGVQQTLGGGNIKVQTK